MKKIRRFSVLLLTAVLLSVPARAAFDDVPESHWAYDSIRLATDYGLVNGMSAKTFGLGQSVTRAQYAMMLCRLMGWTMLSPEQGSFSDNLDRSAWYYSAIETARSHGALLRLDDTCNPNEPLPREEMAAMTVRALGFSATFAGVVQDDCPFADVTTNPGYIALAYRMGFMNGVSFSHFSPKTASTREQAAAVLLRVHDRLNAAVVRSPLAGMPAAVYVEPIADLTGKLPLCPRAPLEKVYEAAVRAGAGGAVALQTAPYAAELANGTAQPGHTVSQEELDALLAEETSTIYHSARYGSSYVLYTGTDGATTVIWYETDSDVAQKVELCQLLGIQTVYVE